MITDNQWIFIEAAQPKANTAGGAADITTGTSFSTNVYRQAPLATANVGIIDWAAGAAEKYFFWIVTTALTSGGAATLNLQLVSSAASDLSSPTVHRETGVLAFDNAMFLVAGNPHTWRVDPNDNWLEYIGVRFVIAGADLTAGSFTALMSNHVDAWKAYASGMVFGY